MGLLDQKFVLLASAIAIGLLLWGGWPCRGTIQNLSSVNLQEKCQGWIRVRTKQDSFRKWKRKKPGHRLHCERSKNEVFKWVSCPWGLLVFRILCVSKLVAPNSDSAFWLGGGCLVSLKVSLGSVKAFVPLGRPSTCPVSFHCSDGIMRFGGLLWSVFPPPWISLDLTGFCYLSSYHGLSHLLLGSIGSCDLLPGF